MAPSLFAPASCCTCKVYRLIVDAHNCFEPQKRRRFTRPASFVFNFQQLNRVARHRLTCTIDETRSTPSYTLLGDRFRPHHPAFSHFALATPLTRLRARLFAHAVQVRPATLVLLLLLLQERVPRGHLFLSDLGRRGKGVISGVRGCAQLFAAGSGHTLSISPFGTGVV